MAQSLNTPTIVLLVVLLLFAVWHLYRLWRWWRRPMPWEQSASPQ